LLINYKAGICIDITLLTEYHLLLTLSAIMTSETISPESLTNFCLSIGVEISAVRSKEDLVRFLDSKLGTMLDIECSTIFLFNGDETFLNDFLVHTAKDVNKSPFAQVIDIERLGKDFSFEDSSPLIDYAKAIRQNEYSNDIWLANAHIQRPVQPNVLPLISGKDLLGYWVVYFAGPEIFACGLTEKLKIVSGQLSLVAAKLRTEELLLERERETGIIQSLNTDFTTTRDRRDLLKVIHYKLKQLFEFESQWVAVINDDQLTMTSFLQEPQSSAKEHPKYQQMLKARYPTNDNFFNKTLLTRDAHVFDVRQISSRQQLPEYMQILYESGVNKIAMIGLHVGDRIIGVWAICLVKDQYLDARQLNLIKGISSQLSIAVDNIIAYEEIKNKEAEREQLLKLSYDISNVRTKADLVKVINNDVRKLFVFENISILLLNDDPRLNDWILASPVPTTMLPPTQDELSDPKQTERVRMGFDMMLKSDGILILDLDSFVKDGNCAPYLKYEHQHGIKEKITLALHDDQRILGMLCVNTREKGIYTEHNLELIKGVTYQISLAVSNILANEDILRREAERELLLSISTDIAAVRSSSELLKVINRRFKNLLGFSHTVIGRIDDDQLSVTPFMRDPDSRSKAHKSYDEAVSKKYTITDGVLDAALDSGKPVVINLEQLSRKMELPLYLKINYESGINQAIVVRFSKGEYVHGFLILFYDDRSALCQNKLNLIESLANQVSVAVLNIIANEEIKTRENEKSRLLAFSNAIASVSDRTMLAKTLKRQLKDLFDINEYVIHKLNADKTKHTPILFDPDADFPKHPDFKKMLNAETDIHDGIFDVILALDEPVFFEIDDWTKLPAEPAYANAAVAENLKTMVGVAIKYGNENIAVMNFKHEDHGRLQQNFSLFKSILSQIAVMVSNIIANDKIINHLAEINNYKQLLEQEKTYLKEEIETSHNYAEIIGDSPQMQKVFRLMAQVSHSDSTVLLLGETGTGKEIVARAIHNNSPRKNKLMVKVNCAALPANLIESELFGHERGSFTGATERRLGKFELANGGTLFLDEIGEMPLDLQVKLLRALQEREIERIGGRGIIKVDVRIIAATNRDLEKEMEEGRFRSDLYYRLNIFPITLPPLRNRKEDIQVLATHFISRFGKKAGRKIKTISTRALQDMTVYNWPGNIRELEHLIERSILLSEGDMLKNVHLPAQKNAVVQQPEKVQFRVCSIDDNERQHILETLKYCQGRVGGYSGAAELLGVPPSTLFSKMKKLGIKRDVISDNLSQ